MSENNYPTKTIPASEIFEYYPDDDALSELRTYAPMLFDDLYSFKKHWPTKSIMERCFSFARELPMEIPFLICPYILSKAIVSNAISDGPTVSAADMHYICNGLGRIFAWLTHQRVYEITSKQAEAILQMRLSETLGLDVLRALPEAGLHIIIPNVPHLNNPELLPSAIFASLDTFENSNNLWLILKVDMRDKTKEFMLQIFDSTANRFLTIEESMKKVDEANRYTLYPCFQILATLISPNLKLQVHNSNVVLLPSNRDVHPAIDKSFVWPKKITRCAVGWVGVSNIPSYEELHKKLWHQKHK